ncbi:membrane protein DedA with SNARE-associated domain [Azospirillum brasilense]|uniref:Membrane protein DedA with SNARE-associated domain n=1 Tax=Azospirillum brasilense TaxID=192 RepID=A0A560ASW4_AZOBR|nr:DedA family protein [Azospirillum brasilense]TWA63450.1 membrane protein DedA with SNARE-associated domain [Azospirillum brasilense]
MDAAVEMVMHFLERHHDWAGPIVAVLAFCESVVLVGLAVPATALMIMFGTLLGLGIIDPVPVVAGAVLGAIAGDAVSYSLGRWLGPTVVYRRPLSRYRAEVAKSRLFFRRYGFAAVFIGRFLGPLRSIVPLVAGMMKMNGRRFQFANVASAALWAPAMLAPGWLASAGVGSIASDTGGFGGIMMAALAGSIALTALIVWFLGPRRRPSRRYR